MPRPANASQNGEPDLTAITSIPGNSVAEMDIDPILQGQDESTLVLTPPATMASSKGPSGLESVEKSTPSGASIGATTAASVTKEVATPTSATMATMLSKDQFADGNDSAERTRQNSLATDFAEFPPPPPLPVRVPAPAATPAAESTTIPSTSKAKTKGAAVPKPKKVLVGEYKPICEQVWCTDNQKNKTAFRQHWSTLTEQERQDWGLGLLAKRKADAEQHGNEWVSTKTNRIEWFSIGITGAVNNLPTLSATHGNPTTRVGLHRSFRSIPVRLMKILALPHPIPSTTGFGRFRSNSPNDVSDGADHGHLDVHTLTSFKFTTTTMLTAHRDLGNGPAGHGFLPAIWYGPGANNRPSIRIRIGVSIGRGTSFDHRQTTPPTRNRMGSESDREFELGVFDAIAMRLARRVGKV
ncbi:hypothetical protein BDN72DRAFT_879127 [Pluteus cervinus]|uniref:Uncharacterized protein n=1 Tax=Pluteus cervinus TaxID=181527 RepID=A0ACD3AR74_9AGAR|nr:hypothetical protein BDN72DRAFT_879127 [Pluteus cervinus]